MSQRIAKGQPFMRDATITVHDAQPYIAVQCTATMEELRDLASHFVTLFATLDEAHLPVVGAPFFRYRRTDMARRLLVDVAIPTTATHSTTWPAGIYADVLPAGRYVDSTYVGHPRNLVDATRELLAWCRNQDLRLDVRDLAAVGQEWGARVEHYESDPTSTPVERSEVRLSLRLHQ